MRTNCTLTLMLILIRTVSSVGGQFAGGAGSETDPWKISTIDQLDSIRLYIDSSFVLINDLDFEGSDFDSDHSEKGWSPLGNDNSEDEHFGGSFNGRGFAIHNLYINRPGDSNIGLFGYIQSATLDSVIIESCNVLGNQNVGAVVGYSNASSLSQSHASGKVSGTKLIGGLVGDSFNSSISASNASVEVSGSNELIGGLIGRAYYYTSLTDCYATGDVDGGNKVGSFAGSFVIASATSSYATGDAAGAVSVGGFSGYAYISTITSCYSEGNVEGSGNNAGGLIANVDQTTIDDCYSTGNVMAIADNIGGLVASLNVGSSVSNSRASGTLFGLTNVGGLVGVVQNASTIDNCNASGGVSGVTNIGGLAGAITGSSVVESFASGLISGQKNVGGFIGKSENDVGVINCYATGDITGSENSGGFVGISQTSSDIELSYSSGNVTGHNYTGGFSGALYGASLTSCHALGTVKGDTIVGGLIGQTADAQVFNCYNRGNVAADAIVGGLIGASGNSIISNSYVTGNTSGTENIIGGLIGITNEGTSLSESYVTGDVSGLINTGGLVGQMSDLVTISYCATYGDVTGTENVGGLVGIDYSSAISNCFATGKIQGDVRVGGLAGLMGEGSEISDCYTTAQITAEENVGGLAGWVYSGSTVMSCYAVGKVSGSTNLGGLIGKNDSDQIESSYFNKQSSELENGIGQDGENQTVVGLTTLEMKQQSSFLGFNFSSNWAITVNETYPALLGLNNAPFAFQDTIQGRVSDVFPNDKAHDFESGKTDLVYELNTVVSESQTKSATYEFGDSLWVTYRVGEYRVDLVDTLWGGYATTLVLYNNHAPEITSTAPDRVDVGSAYSYQVSSTDEDGDPLSYSLSGQPEGMIINDAGLIFWEIPDEMLLSTEIMLTVSDGELEDTEVFTIVVNHAPMITSVAPTSAVADEEYVYEVEVTDVNGDQLLFGLLSQPEGMVVDESGKITWTPSFGTTTSGEVTLTVSDGFLTDSQYFSISVEAVALGLIDLEYLKIWPNPTSDYIMVQNDFQADELQLIAASGKILESINITNYHQYQLDMNGMTPGIYLVCLKKGDMIFTQRIIKE